MWVVYMRRRRFLATLGAGALAGCGALGGSEIERAEDPFTQVESATADDRGIVRSGLVVLGENEYASVGFQGGAGGGSFPIEMTGQVMQGGGIDVYIMTLDQFNQYKRQPNLITSEVEITGTQSPSVNRQLQPGEYFLVFDNTTMGSAEPSGEARIQFSFTVGDATGTSTPTDSQ
jgi:hypothetical protein